MQLNDQAVKSSKILIVDDDVSNVLLVRRLLELSGYHELHSTSDSRQALDLYDVIRPDLVLLDLHMPGLSGFEVMSQIQQRNSEVFLPILVFSGDVSKASKKSALEAGASDFLTKPSDPNEVALRVQNFLKMRLLHRETLEQKQLLEQRVHERTRQLEESQKEVMERLVHAGEFRDDDTGEHALRVGDVAGMIAENLGLSAEQVDLIRAAAPLHDIGKIGVSDTVLLKPGRLTVEEFELVKQHTIIGAQILKNGRTDLVRMAECIALNHHEKWDGSGYPNQLSGHSIPLPGRIVAVADVFDALTHDRPYKAAWNQQDAVNEIRQMAGSHFDPQVVDAFLQAFAALSRAA